MWLPHSVFETPREQIPDSLLTVLAVADQHSAASSQSATAVRSGIHIRDSTPQCPRPARPGDPPSQLSPRMSLPSFPRYLYAIISHMGCRPRPRRDNGSRPVVLRHGHGEAPRTPMALGLDDTRQSPAARSVFSQIRGRADREARRLPNPNHADEQRRPSGTGSVLEAANGSWRQQMDTASGGKRWVCRRSEAGGDRRQRP